MAGLGIRLYTDEDVDAELAIQLTRHGYDAVSSVQVGNSGRGLTDEEQLGYASDRGLAILVHNARHYVPLDRAWKERGMEHAGIIVAEQIRLPELFRRVRRYLDTISPGDQRDTLRFLHP